MPAFSQPHTIQTKLTTDADDLCWKEITCNDGGGGGGDGAMACQSSGGASVASLSRARQNMQLAMGVQERVWPDTFNEPLFQEDAAPLLFNF